MSTKFKGLKKVDTPFIDEKRDIQDEDLVNVGELGPIATKILMKLLYVARMARYDLLRPVCALASVATKWNAACDKKLYRLMCYVYTTQDLRLISWVGNTANELKLKIFTDADFAGEKISSDQPMDKRSTSGVFLVLAGDYTFFPLSAVTKKQTATSHSTTEAEVIAAALGIREHAIPAKVLFEHIYRRRVECVLYEDNTATKRII